MPTLLLQRLRRLQPSSQPRWGTFTAPRMVCHLADALRVGLGDVSSKGVDTLLSRTLLATGPTIWIADVSTLEQLIGRTATTSTTAAHPTFGPLTREGWGRLTWKHVDHHLRQFGC